MILLEKQETFGWESAIRGMRNPMNSWDKSDSGHKPVQVPPCNDICIQYVVGKNDLVLMKKLVLAGSDHGKFLRMINVTLDITAPLYWWKEFDTYKVGTVANSCSTMHKIAEKEFTMNDFSTEHMKSETAELMRYHIIPCLNYFRECYVRGNEKGDWWQMIQLLPTSYNQKRTVQLNYQVLRNIYFARRNHKLDEWHTLCALIEKLPYAADIICVEGEHK